MFAYCGPPLIGIFLRSFPLNRPPLFAGNDRRRSCSMRPSCYARSARSQAVRGSPRGQPARRTRRAPRYGDH